MADKGKKTENQTEIPTGEPTRALALSNDEINGGIVNAPTEEEVSKLLDGMSIEKFYTIEEGQLIKGVLLGRGAPQEFEDDRTGDTREVGTWRIQISKTVVLRVLSSAQLENALPPACGHMISIQRRGEVKTRKGYRVTDWLIGVGPLVRPDLEVKIERPDGKRAASGDGDAPF